MELSDLDFELPPALVPMEPTRPRGSSRLMVVDRLSGKIEHMVYSALPELLGGEVVYLNNSRIRGTDPAHEDRRQPIYATRPGGTGSPTAGLDLTKEILAHFSPSPRLLTLHVGDPSFRKLKGYPSDPQPVGWEEYEITDPPRGGEKVFAVGTTVVRALESWAHGGLQRGWTDLVVAPGHEFRTIKGLVTNFHTPRDPHMLLVVAFAGLDTIREAYELAKREGYLFSGYGDAMLIR